MQSYMYSSCIHSVNICLACKWPSKCVNNPYMYMYILHVCYNMYVYMYVTTCTCTCTCMLSCSAERASGGSGVLETGQVSSIPHCGSQRANETIESQMTSNAVSTQAGMQGRLIVGSLCMYTYVLVCTVLVFIHTMYIPVYI